MMMPIVEVPATIARQMENYRHIFYRNEGFEHICRYLTGLLLLPNKTLQGIYHAQVWPDKENQPSRRAMHKSIFETRWDLYMRRNL